MESYKFFSIGEYVSAHRNANATTTCQCCGDPIRFNHRVGNFLAGTFVSCLSEVTLCADCIEKIDAAAENGESSDIAGVCRCALCGEWVSEDDYVPDEVLGFGLCSECAK